MGVWINAVVKSVPVDQGRKTTGWPVHCLVLANFVNTATTAFICAALWTQADPVSRFCAVVISAVSGTHTLLRFAPHTGLLALFLAPIVVAIAYVAVDSLGISHGSILPIVALAAVFICLVNFLAGSRRQIIADRDKLVDARQKAAEGERAAAAANAAKSQFLATMSHEIRTPLNGVLGMAQAMAADELLPRQRTRLEIVRQSGEALLTILNDILDLSKIEAGKLELETVEFSLSELAHGAHAAFTGLASKKGLSFPLDLHDAQGTYRGDPVRLRQIMSNLISNALKFTEEGEVGVVVSWRNGVLTLRVADTGLGIAPEALKRLFEKFTQADASTTRRFGGTGLGLAICRHLAEAMNGSILVESQPGEGSRFTLSAPLEQVKEDSSTAMGAPTPVLSSLAFQTPLRVLAAEDNAVNQLVLKTLLQQAGINPVVVDDGIAAVEAWQRAEWDLILMDVQMPRLDGPTATKRIRELELERGGRRTPILALTANAMPDQVARYIALGMDGHIAKPIEVSELFAALERALAGEQLQAKAHPPARPSVAAAC